MKQSDDTNDDGDDDADSKHDDDTHGGDMKHDDDGTNDDGDKHDNGDANMMMFILLMLTLIRNIHVKNVTMLMTW